MSDNDDKVHVGFGQLKKAFEDHWANGSNGADPSHYLLRFYSVECGFKSMYIDKVDKYHKRTSKDLKDVLDIGHKLDFWIHELELPARSIPSPPQFQLHSTIEPKSQRKIYRAHEAWRYGAKIDEEHEEALLEWLDKARKLIKEKLKEV